MTRARVIAAIAALLSALLLQATLVGPLTIPAPVSLPALLVAAVALVDGPGAGMAFGFAVGLVADLGSDHPAGVLALCWLGVGLVCGLCSAPYRRTTVRRDAVIAALACGAAALVSGEFLAVLHWRGGEALSALRLTIPGTLLDAVLALAVVALVRLFLHTSTLRAPRPVLLVGSNR